MFARFSPVTTLVFLWQQGGLGWLSRPLDCSPTRTIIKKLTHMRIVSARCRQFVGAAKTDLRYEKKKKKEEKKGKTAPK